MKVMIPSGVGRLSVAIKGTMTMAVRIPPWIRKEVTKLANDLPARPSGTRARSNISLGTAFDAPFARSSNNDFRYK
jgi:hypothetical protein